MIALALSTLIAQTATLESVNLDVNGVQRQFLVYFPKTKDAKPRPIIFGFHGHGGNMRNASRAFNMHEQIPQAISVYMQGLPTKGQLTDPEGKKNGWQRTPGDYEDRDVKFFESVLKWLDTKAIVNHKQIFATGHSNGGGFTYLLWQMKPNQFRAIAPSGAGGRAANGTGQIPVLHISGKNDELVKFPMQLRSVNRVKQNLGCTGPGTEWAPGATRWQGQNNSSVTHYIYDGGHEYPKEAAELTARFFKEQMSE